MPTTDYKDALKEEMARLAGLVEQITDLDAAFLSGYLAGYENRGGDKYEVAEA